jgi:regulatory protein
MRRKLTFHARAETALRGEAGDPVEMVTLPAHQGGTACTFDPEDARARVEAVLDWLEAHRYLSQQRFVESRVQARATRFGNLRIRMELAQHDAALTPEVAAVLRDSEFERARAVWQRKFAHASPADMPVAKQARFLAGRGFSVDVIRRVLREPRAEASDTESADLAADFETK